eukprot:g35732.t1
MLGEGSGGCGSQWDSSSCQPAHQIYARAYLLIMRLEPLLQPGWLQVADTTSGLTALVCAVQQRAAAGSWKCSASSRSANSASSCHVAPSSEIPSWGKVKCFWLEAGWLGVNISWWLEKGLSRLHYALAMA